MKNRVTKLLCTASALLLPAACMAQTAKYSVADLGYLPSHTDYTYADALNNNGQVVGRGQRFSDQDIRAFSYINGQMTLLPSLGGNDDAARGVNDQGVIVGHSNGAPVKWVGGSVYRLSPNGYTGSAICVNESGQIGGVLSANGVIWTDAGLTYVGRPVGYDFSQVDDINDSGNALVNVYSSSNSHCYIWLDGQLQDLGTFGGTKSWGVAINNSNQIVGDYTGSDGQQYGFLWQDGHTTLLGSFLPYSINNLGVIAGYYGNGLAIWQNGSVTRYSTSVPGWYLWNPTAINDKGQIAGYGYISGVEHGFLATPVPEPASLLALFTGLAGIAGAAVRRVK